MRPKYELRRYDEIQIWNLISFVLSSRQSSDQYRKIIIAGLARNILKIRSSLTVFWLYVIYVHEIEMGTLNWLVNRLK